MADFCKQCSIEIFGEDYGDFNFDRGKGPLPPDIGWVANCEGCGPTLVNDEGECISPYCLKHHGLPGGMSNES